ncbi:MAG: hypothetical protein K0A99_05925 [Desulfoarculaceae bacterium]|nr:hypothetical protein [Desulfoarculaceae bacterium]
MTRSSQRVCDRPEFLERRQALSSRRKTDDRRLQEERRFDNRVAKVSQRKAVKGWLRSLFRSRLGVDRRKKRDRRKIVDRRRQSLGAILTREEIADLLS